MAEAREKARKKYDDAYARLREELEQSFRSGGTNSMLSPAIPAFNAALADLMLTGLDEYLEAAAEDRKSAARDRESAAADRQADRAAAEADKRKQDSDRTAMNRFTRAIMFAAIASAAATALSAGAMIWGITKAPNPPATVAPTVASVPAPIQPVPVNVTAPPPPR